MDIFLAYCRHDSDSDRPPIKCFSYDSAVDEINDHFLSYDFVLKNGKPFDSGNDDGENGGYECFTNLKIYNGKIAQFTHHNGEGPIGFIEKI